MKTIDLTAPITDEMPVFPGDPPFRRKWHAFFDSYPVCCSALSFGPHTGTHVDAPLHFIKDGASIDEMAIERFYGEGICLDCQNLLNGEIGLADVSSTVIRPGVIVLFHTGWQQRSGSQDFYEPKWPGLSEEAARFLVDRGVKAVGIDSPSIDSMPGLAAGAPAHHILLGSGLPIFESLVNLDKIARLDFTFYGLPLLIRGCEASPIRAVAQLH